MCQCLLSSYGIIYYCSRFMFLFCRASLRHRHCMVFGNADDDDVCGVTSGAWMHNAHAMRAFVIISPKILLITLHLPLATDNGRWKASYKPKPKYLQNHHFMLLSVYQPYLYVYYYYSKSKSKIYYMHPKVHLGKSYIIMLMPFLVVW